MVDDKDNLLAWIALNIINRQKRIKFKLKKKKNMISWEWDFLEVSSICEGGGIEFVGR